MEKITSRAVIGYIKRMLSQDIGLGWVNGIANFFVSDQASEEYAWLGAPPAMQEWIGQRKAKGLPEYDFTIKNKKHEATLEFPVRWMRRDKFNMIETRIQEMVLRGQAHWAKLLSSLIVNGESTACYDGQYFFDTDHSEGDSGTQSNDIGVDISALALATHGSTSSPAVAEMQLAIAQGITNIAGFLDDQGEPMNEEASAFLVMVPMSLYHIALQAAATPVQVAETQTALETPSPIVGRILPSSFHIRFFMDVLDIWPTMQAIYVLASSSKRGDFFLVSGASMGAVQGFHCIPWRTPQPRSRSRSRYFSICRFLCLGSGRTSGRLFSCGLPLTFRSGQFSFEVIWIVYYRDRKKQLW